MKLNKGKYIKISGKRNDLGKSVLGYTKKAKEDYEKFCDSVSMFF